jgi:RNA polymerase sigma-70 factor (ECF subfamily)
VRGADTSYELDLTRQREVVDAFLAAARDGDFDALVAVLDPDVVLRSDRAALPADAPREVRGAPAVARRALVGRARAARPALVDGAVGVIVTPRGRLLMVLDFKIRDGKIVEIDAVADPERLNQLDLALLDS